MQAPGCPAGPTSAPNMLVVDFMLPSPITDDDDNYWDALHYRVGIADRIVHDLAAADRGEASADYRNHYRRTAWNSACR